MSQDIAPRSSAGPEQVVASVPSVPTPSTPGSHVVHHMKYGPVSIAGYAPEATKRGGSIDGKDEGLTSTPEPHHQQIERRDAEHREVHEGRRYMFRRPRPLQYFRGNILVRGEDERSSHRLELFFDLVFVALVVVLAKQAVHEHDAIALVRYMFTYTAAWLVWNYMREIFDAFFVDDAPQRLLVLFVVAALVIYGNNAVHVENTEHGAKQTAIGSYLAATGLMMALTLYYSFYIRQYRLQIRFHFVTWLVAAGIWIGAIFVEARISVVLAAIALALENVAWLFFYSPVFQRVMKLTHSPAVAIEHEIERHLDFVTLVHGEFLLAILYGQPAGEGMHVGAAKAILTVIIAFFLHGLYCQGAGSRQFTHPIRHSGTSCMTWFSLHLPFVAAITLCGDTTAELVHEQEVPQGIRWMFSGSYAVAMLSLTCIALLERETDKPGELWFSKTVRIAPRLLAATIVLLLPLSNQEHINSATLLGIAAVCTALVFGWQEIGSLDGPNASWYQEGGDDQSIYPPGLVRKWKGYPTIIEPGSWNLHPRDRKVSI